MSTREKDIENFFRDTEKLVSKYIGKSTSSETHNFLKELYKILHNSKWKVKSYMDLNVIHQNILLSLLKHLASLLFNNVVPVDSLLLSGTCLSVTIAQVFSPCYASSVLISLLYFVKNSTSHLKLEGLKDILTNSKISIEDSRDLCNAFKKSHSTPSENESSLTFPQIAILHGILSYQEEDLFLFKSNLFKTSPFLMELYELIYPLCASPCSSHYHAFSVLLSWLKTCEKYLPRFLQENPSNANVFFSSETDVLSKSLFLLESNWESPIKGVSTFVKESYRVLIGLSLSECEILKNVDFNICNYLLCSIMKLSWQVKGKYVVLSVITQFIPYKEFLQRYTEFPEAVIFNMKANYAATAVSETYKAVVTNMKNQCSSSNELISEWCLWWKTPILKSLNSENKSLIQNVVNLILPWTMKNIPNSYNCLVESYTKDNHIFPQLTLIYVAKESGNLTLGDKEYNILQKFLHHQEINVRMEILSILCCSPKKSDPFSPQELQLLKEFIQVNLNIDSTPFQQLFLSQMRIALVRIRDSLVQDYRMLLKNPDFVLNQSQLEFVEWVYFTALRNTFPGACFQRRRVSLLFLTAIFDVFVTSVQGSYRKEKPSKLVEKVVQTAQAKNCWLFFKDDSLLNIFPCLTDFTDEIRSITFKLLSDFSNWPTVNHQNTFLNEVSLFNYAKDLCNHPDYRNNDAGAHLYCFVFKKLKICQKNFSDPAVLDEALEFLNEFIISAKAQLNSAKENFLHAASSLPIHGLLLALQYCLNNFKETARAILTVEKEKILNFLETVLNFCDEIIQYMLLVMKGNDDKDNCPSFMDINKALENLVLTQQNNSNEVMLEQNQDIIAVEKPTPSQLELLLSCCWHSIKNSCSLLCEVSSYICHMEISMDIKKQHLTTIATVLSSILISCRHRGVVDACSISLNRFCTMLLKDEFLHEEICKYLLNMVFNTLMDASSTSVTRRSAGLPSLCQAIVSSEKSNINRKLLSFTVKTLLETIKQPVSSLSDKTDLSQAHAFHILKALVMEASLSQAILMHLDSIIPACIAGFSSDLWPIRNGALQLFGVLLPRICGQKKVSDDESEYNLVSASELFARCPSLENYLLQQLKKCVTLHKERKLSSELIPILSIIVKLSPPQEDSWILFTELKTLLLELMSVPVWKIRDLLSTILSVIMNFEDILKQIDYVIQKRENNSMSYNEIHGILYIVKKFLLKNKNISADQRIKITDRMESMHIFLLKLKLPLLEALSLEIFNLLINENQSCIQFDILQNAELFTSDNFLSVGKELYFNQVCIFLLKSSPAELLPALIEQQSSNDISVQINCYQFLISKLGTHQSLLSQSEIPWNKIYIVACNAIIQGRHCSVIQTALKFVIKLYSLSNTDYNVIDCNVTDPLEKVLLRNIENSSSLSIIALSFTLWSYVLKYKIMEKKINESSLLKWNTLFNSFSQPRSPDILRIQAANSVDILGPMLIQYTSEKIYKNSDNIAFILISLCEGCLLLLQDEDEDIRRIACAFPSHINQKYSIKSLQFNIGITVLLEVLHQNLHSSNIYIQYLWNKLQNFPSSVKILQMSMKSVKTSLFEQEYVNVYAEPTELVLKYRYFFLNSMNDFRIRNYEDWKNTLQMYLLDIRTEVNDINHVITDNSFKISQGFAFPHQVFLSFLKIHSVLQVFEAQKNFMNPEDELHAALEKVSNDWESIKKIFNPINSWFLKEL